MQLIRAAEVDGRLVDVVIDGATIGSVHAVRDDYAPGTFSNVWSARGGALLPGLHDHHIHLASLAASRMSVDCGPPMVENEADLARAIAAVGSSGWIRGVGYHESVAGLLSREQMDAFAPVQPLRIQHRSGKIWYLNSAAMQALGSSTHELFREDDRLRTVGWSFDLTHGLADVATTLIEHGVVGVTDATPSNDERQAQHLQSLPLDVRVMGCDDLGVGHRKILLDDAVLPDLDDLIATIRRAHDHARSVAVHCVTRTELILALAAIDAAGPSGADRIEHASVADEAAFDLMRRTAVTVVTQPNFVYERGDRYLVDVDERDRSVLYRLAGFDRAGVPLGGGTDAPFGSPDPWLAVRAATMRRTREGRTLGASEALSPERALALFTTDPSKPGGESRQIVAGARAHLCLLDRPWARARTRLVAEDVRATFIDGLCRYHREIVTDEG